MEGEIDESGMMSGESGSERRKEEKSEIQSERRIEGQRNC